MLVSGMMADEQKMSGTFCSQNSCLHERPIYDDRETFYGELNIDSSMNWSTNNAKEEG